MLLIAWSAFSPSSPSAFLTSSAIVCQAVAPQLERDQQRLLGGRHVARHAQRLRLLERLVGRALVAEDRLIELGRRRRAGAVHLLEELVAGLLGLGADAG